MSKSIARILLCTLLVVVVGCSRDDGSQQSNLLAPDAELTTADVDQIALEIAIASGWELDPELAPSSSGEKRRCFLLDMQRDDLGNGLAHYAFLVNTGPGEHDRIGIHRVVQERRPFRPVRSRTSVFLQHGDIKDFVGMFLPGFQSPRQPDDRGLAAYLAATGLDVWGIDQAWALVPAEVTEHGFMEEWGLARAADDLEVGIAVARTLRLFTGNGWRKMQLLGYSSGAATGFVYLGREAQRPPGHRHVNAYIAADYGLVSNDPGWQETGCADAAGIQGAMDAGLYGFDNPFVFFGPPALEDPDGPSDLIPGFTNLQAGLALAVYPAYEGFGYHFLAGTFDENGIPDGLQYTPVDDWIDFMVYSPPYEAHRFMLDYSEATCDPESVPWDDQLGDITVPIFWLEAAGGAAPMMRHTLDVVGSSDITELIISFYPPEDVLADFAHIDLFIGTDAPTLVWDPMLHWIEDQGWQ